MAVLFRALREVLEPSLTPEKEDPRQAGPCQVEGGCMIFLALPAQTEGGVLKTCLKERSCKVLSWDTSRKKFVSNA